MNKLGGVLFNPKKVEWRTWPLLPGFQIVSTWFSCGQVGRESFLSKYPQMRTESFFVYLVVLWSLGLLSLRWPARIQHQDAWRKWRRPKRFTWKKIPVALSSAPSVDMNLQSNTMPGTGKHTNLMGGGSLCKEPVLTLHWPTKNAVNRRISMLKLHIFDCITISYMIWNK